MNEDINERVSICMNKLRIKTSNTEEMKLVFTAQSKAFFYCRDVICEYVFRKDYLPINPFRIFDYFLNDRVDRNLIRRGNNHLIRICDELWVFGNISDGVLFEIASAIQLDKPIKFFSIGSTLGEIREISIDQIACEPEVHAKKIKKQDIVEFIKSGKIEMKEIRQMDLFNISF